ncbi:hypothetical protein ACTWP5_23545 [Streptomyces sp. 4N509B]|uniref:hypothetical protein n=1 Tax=Streptomyces sp. 4N509B TaxID=3457413 RepID=UPI003FD1FD31
MFAQASSTYNVAYPLGGAVAWLMLLGPVFLRQSRSDRKTRHRILDAARAIPAPIGADGALACSTGEHAGLVSYSSESLRVTTENGTVTDIPLTEVHFAEELPPKSMWGLPGIDVLTKVGHWTEILVIDNTELIAALERAGAPVVRARNFRFKKTHT